MEMLRWNSTLKGPIAQEASGKQAIVPENLLAPTARADTGIQCHRLDRYDVLGTCAGLRASQPGDAQRGLDWIGSY